MLLAELIKTQEDVTAIIQLIKVDAIELVKIGDNLEIFPIPSVLDKEFIYEDN